MGLTDENVKNHVAPNGKLIPNRCRKDYLIKHGLYDYVMNRYSDNSMNKDNDEKRYISETLYRMLNGIETRPKCKVCGRLVVYPKCNKYPNYCSHACSNHDEDVIKKMSHSCSDSLKKAYEKNGDEIKQKRINTLSERFGVEVNSPTPFAVKEIQNKASKQVQEIYGVKNVFQLDWVREKKHESERKQSIELQKERGIDLEYLDDGRYLVKNCCSIHGDLVYTQSEFNNRFRPSRYYFSNPCYICNPFNNSGVSGKEKSLLEYIESIYDGEIITNSKSILDERLELDIYLPDLKLGFEFNGNYWHMNPLYYKSDDINPSSKTSAFEKWKDDRHKLLLAEQKGITVYHVWEHYYVNESEQQLEFIKNLVYGHVNYTHPFIKLKRELDKIGNFVVIDDMIFESSQVKVVYLEGFYFNKNTINKKFISNLISKDKRTIFVYDYEISDERKFDVILSTIRFAMGIIGERIYARTCEIREITNKDSKQFLIENSIFGYRPASVVLGLYHNNELVMVYSFGNNYYGRNKDTEIIRVCTKKDTQIIGGSSKCLKYYEDKFGNDGETLVFYVDSIHHDGRSMVNTEFEHVKHEYGLMNYYVMFNKLGESFNRSPSRNTEVKGLIKHGKIVEVITNGVDVYKKIIKK